VTIGARVDTIFFGLGANNGDFIYQRLARGLPVRRLLAAPITGFSDANADGIIARTRSRSADQPAYPGQPFAARTR
jgi:hypothetical protein